MIVIVGGGICGLAIGWRLAEAALPVTVIDRGNAGRGATWAAAGMLAPRVEIEYGEEGQLPLLLESRAMWPSFARDLERASGIDVGYRTEGTIVVALDRDDRERLEHRYAHMKDLGLDVEMLTRAEAQRREPCLTPSVVAALYSPEDHQVDNRAVIKALWAAYLGAGGTLIEDDGVEEVLILAGRASGVRLRDRKIAADTVVLAAGAWSRDIGGIPDPLRPPVRPLKGQMLALQMPTSAPLIDHVVWGPEIYLVPRRDGRLLVGATVEEKGFDTVITAGGIYDLLRRAWDVLPGIYDLPLIESWAGLRPASRDDAPILGPTAMPGLIMATGHHRNGILLAPVTAAGISHLILHGETPSIILPYALNRFDPDPPAARRAAI